MDHSNDNQLVKTQTKKITFTYEPMSESVFQLLCELSAGHTKKEGNPLEAKLKQQIAKWGFQIEPVPADGNCFFEAVSRQLTVMGASETAGELREKAVNYLRENASKFEGFIVVDKKIFDRF